MQTNRTLYVCNLNDKIGKEELKQVLYYLFLPYGRILDIVALKTLKARGQAFIAFSDIQNATKAMRELQGMNVFGKELKIEYAKSKSNVHAIEDGTYQPPVPLQDQQTAENENDSNEEEEKDDEEMEEMPQAGNTILHLENLPSETSEEMLVHLFAQYPGFKDVRLVTGKSEVAFVEYETVAQASVAKNVLNGFKLSKEHALRISYSKR